MSHVLCDQELHAQIREEISKHGKDNINMSALLNDCPHLGSVYNEALRVFSSGGLLREVTSPTVIGSKTLDQGEVVVVRRFQWPFSGDY